MSLCFFANNQSLRAPRGPATDLEAVQCDPGSTKLVSEYLEDLPDGLNLYGCSAIELLYLRGNGQNLCDVISPEDHVICKAHLDFLLLNWPNAQQCLKIRRSGVRVPKCSLPHDSSRAVTNGAYIRKEESIEWLQRTGELIHVGSAICSVHRASLQKGELKASVASRKPPIRSKSANCDDMDFDLDPHDDFSTDNEDTEVPTDPTVTNEISMHFASIAKLMGNSHYATKEKWDDLGEDSKRRKISLVVNMMQLLCSLVAPGNPEDLAESVCNKLSPRVKESSDSCAKQVLSVIGERMIDAPTRRARIETLSLIVDLPFFSASKILLTIPTVTRYLIHKARMFSRGGIDFNQKFTKVRYNEKAVDFLVSFLARSNVLITLSWINNFATKSDGSQVEMGVSVRLQSYARIDRMYREELRKYNKDKSWALSYGTVYKLLSEIVPRKNKRMTCVDEYAADAGEASLIPIFAFENSHFQAWDRLEEYVVDLGKMSKLTEQEETDLRRRVKLARSFLDASFRTHIEASSSVIEHCATFALSDPKKPAYRNKCTHVHDSHCEECREIDRVLQILDGKLRAAFEEASKNDEPDRFKFERMCGMGEKCAAYIKAFQCHVVRTGPCVVVSDQEKARVQGEMKDTEVLITADWAQKQLSQAAIEAQSGYFGKAGMSVHITHGYAKFDGKAYHHSIQHVFDSCKQMSYDVAAVLRHSLGIFKAKGITRVTREDGVLCRKHAGIGSGLKTVHSKLHSLKPTMTIVESGGYLDEGFWVPLEDGSVGDPEEDFDADSHTESMPSKRKDFLCSTPGCVASFLKLHNLEIHERIGNHKFNVPKKSLLDCTIDSLNSKIATLDVAKEERENDTFACTPINGDEGLNMGWALKKNTKSGITDRAYEAASEYFMTQRLMVPPRRAEPRAFSLMMEEMMHADGRYKFEASELLTEKQLVGLFSRLEKKRTTGVSVERKRRGRQPSKSSRKRKAPLPSEDEKEEEDEELESEPEEEEVDEPIDEEDYVRDCIKAVQDDVFE